MTQVKGWLAHIIISSKLTIPTLYLFGQSQIAEVPFFQILNKQTNKNPNSASVTQSPLPYFLVGSTWFKDLHTTSTFETS